MGLQLRPRLGLTTDGPCACKLMRIVSGAPIPGNTFTGP